MTGEKVLITGGAGFIGSHLVDKLMADNYSVTAYDNLSLGKVENIKAHLGRKNFEFVEADLLDIDKLDKTMAGHDIVFHLAANQDLRIATTDTSVDLYQETIATYNVLETVRRHGIKKIVFSSSATIYGDVPLTPISEDYGPVLPISLYGAGKLAGEALVSSFCHIFDMQAWVFRFTNIIGARASHGVIYDFVNKLKRNTKELEILGDGKQDRPFLHVEECVEGILFGLNYSSEQFNLYNLGFDSFTNVVTIADMVVEEMGLENVSYRFAGGRRGWRGDVPQLRFNIDKINHLGWKARLTSDEAVRKAVKEIVHELTT